MHGIKGVYKFDQAERNIFAPNGHSDPLDMFIRNHGDSLWGSCRPYNLWHRVGQWGKDWSVHAYYPTSKNHGLATMGQYDSSKVLKRIPNGKIYKSLLLRLQRFGFIFDDPIAWISHEAGAMLSLPPLK